MIICTEKDREFEQYRDKVKNKKVIFTIKEIFKDWWNKFLETYPKLNIRDVVFSNVERMLKCKTWDLGYAVYKCPNCGEKKIVPHTCKSRLCSSCGNKYNKQRESSIFSKLFRCKHRHVVFTIPDELRIYFREDRKRLNYLLKPLLLLLIHGLKTSTKRKNLSLLIFLFFILLAEVLFLILIFI